MCFVGADNKCVYVWLLVWFLLLLLCVCGCVMIYRTEIYKSYVSFKHKKHELYAQICLQ